MSQKSDRTQYKVLRGVAAFVVATLLVSCNNHSGSSHSVRQLKKGDLTPAEIKYGIAPIPDSTVTYQPDVIVVGGGAQSIRSQSSDGYSWTIDSSAPHAAELVPGKVIFMTNRAVGRVLGISKSGNDLVITIGPVDLTEIVREAHIHIPATPLDLSEALTYTSVDLPGQLVAATAPQRATAPMPAGFAADSGGHLYRTLATQPAPTTPGAAGSPAAAVPVPDVSSLLAKNFKAVPTASKSGIGVRVSADGGGLLMSAEALVHLSAPEVVVDLDIVPPGKVTNASIELKGAAGLGWNFQAGTDVGLKGNVNGLLQPDTDFVIPLGGMGPVPFAITIRQRFLITTGLGVRNSTIRAAGDYTFKGGFKMGYLNGAWDVRGPEGFTSVQSMSRTGAGLSMGVEGLNLADTLKIIAGVGAHGFASGPYVTFTSAIGAFRGSDIGMIKCSGATLDISLAGGIGYVIPKSITGLINSFLHKLNINIQITGEGGLGPTPAVRVLNKVSQVGGCNVDPNPNAVGTLNGPV